MSSQEETGRVARSWQQVCFFPLDHVHQPLSQPLPGVLHLLPCIFAFDPDMVALQNCVL